MMLEMDKKMKPGRRQVMNKIEKLYDYDRHMVLDWFIDYWPLFESGLRDLIEEEINHLSRERFLMVENRIAESIAALNLDKPDNVIPFKRAGGA